MPSSGSDGGTTAPRVRRKALERARGSFADGCPVAVAHHLLSGRWRLAIAFALLDGPCRFGELRTRIPGISANLLSQRLRTMSEDGIVAGGDGGPYALTAGGAGLSSVRDAISVWSRAGGGSPPSRR